MLKSISNNFGSPEIMFRAAQHDRYVVLNAHFTYDPADAAYLAARELEIKLPDLSISKSTEAGIIAVHKDIYESPYGDTYRYHFPAVLRSRIRDRNTLCIEKAAGFDAYGPVQVYIHAMCSSLNTGELTGLSERTPSPCPAPRRYPFQVPPMPVSSVRTGHGSISASRTPSARYGRTWRLSWTDSQPMLPVRSSP